MSQERTIAEAIVHAARLQAVSAIILSLSEKDEGDIDHAFVAKSVLDVEDAIDFEVARRKMTASRESELEVPVPPDTRDTPLPNL